MAKPDLLKSRDKRTAKRKIDKKNWDAMFDLSAQFELSSSSRSIRLLDEGMVTYADGSPYFYIKKGTLQKLVSGMSDDYVGSINLGHMDFARFPYILGTWTKKDLSLEDIGDGRMALNVVPHFDQDSVFLQELKRQPYDVAVSAEFRGHIDYELSRRYGVDIMDEIYPEGFNFAIVGEPGNVNSAGLRLALKGENMTIEELSAAIEENKPTNLTELSALLNEDIPEETTEVEEAVTPEESEETTEAVPEALEAAETDENEEEHELTLEEVASQVEALRSENANLTEQVNTLTAQVAELTSERDGLRTQLSAAQEAEKNFISKFKNIRLVSTSEPKKPEPKAPKAAYTDGFGE